MSCRMRAATLTAIEAGALPSTSGMPMGVVTRASAASACPSSPSFTRNRAHFELEPISPIDPRSPRRSA